VLISIACLCWAIDNNLTRKVSASDALFVAGVKGLIAGTVNCVLALFLGLSLPTGLVVFSTMSLGLMGYGLSLVLFVLALRGLGTARTGAYFSTAPFIGAAISVVLLGEATGGLFWLAAFLMAVGVWIHLTEHHEHEHHHEALEHEHGHTHDVHHLHIHNFAWDGQEPHDHKHVHGPDCNHEHHKDESSGHEDCGHDHSHGSAPVRFIVLLLPIVLFFLNVPNEVFSNVKGVDLSQFGEVGTVAEKGIDFNVGFLQLEMASMTQESRNHYEGKTVRLIGKYVGEEEKRFSLIRFKINCCAADAVPLNAVMMVDPNSPEKLAWKKYANKWVQVTGRVHFLKRKDNEQYMTALVLYPDTEHKLNDDLVKVVPQDSNPYAN
jgi:hypothetical protein